MQPNSADIWSMYICVLLSNKYKLLQVVMRCDYPGLPYVIFPPTSLFPYKNFRPKRVFLIFKKSLFLTISYFVKLLHT